ncbi:hypothetical protein F5Y19DRAFT_480830 [Xylariaceae sp. FL1651]|nr:hypothetical protein F5Y19DRAFT_480830 [Xylariaceae sp. FL1651]
MRFNQPIYLVLAAIATQVQAKCYSGGEAWGPGAQNAAKTACEKNLSGNYQAQGTTSGEKSVCIDVDGKKNEFHIWHIKKGDRTLGVPECEDGLLKEVTGCSHGGESSYTNWKYKYEMHYCGIDSN